MMSTIMHRSPDSFTLGGRDVVTDAAHIYGGRKNTPLKWESQCWPHLFLCHLGVNYSSFPG